MPDSIKHNALAMLYKEQKRAKINLANAERRNAPEETISNLQRKLAALDWLIGAAIQAD